MIPGMSSGPSIMSSLASIPVSLPGVAQIEQYQKIKAPELSNVADNLKQLYSKPIKKIESLYKNTISMYTQKLSPVTPYEFKKEGPFRQMYLK